MEERASTLTSVCDSQKPPPSPSAQGKQTRDHLSRIPEEFLRPCMSNTDTCVYVCVRVCVCESVCVCACVRLHMGPFAKGLSVCSL